MFSLKAHRCNVAMHDWEDGIAICGNISVNQQDGVYLVATLHVEICQVDNLPKLGAV